MVMHDHHHHRFTTAVHKYAAQLGLDAPRIAAAIIKDLFPESRLVTAKEGCHGHLHVGVTKAVKGSIKRTPSPSDQRAFDEIDPSFEPLTRVLSSVAYMVPSLSRHVAVPELIAREHLLKEAAEYMLQKGNENLVEADKLTALLRAVQAKRRATEGART